MQEDSRGPVVVMATQPGETLLAEIAAGSLQGEGEWQVRALGEGAAPGSGIASVEPEAAAVLVYLAHGDMELPHGAERWLAGGAALLVVDLTGKIGVDRAVRWGARGNVGPGASRTALVERVRQVAAGRSAFPPEAMEALRAALRRVEETGTGLDRLTEAQRQLARWVAEGLAVKEMARRLGISQTAVRDWLRRIMTRLGVGNLRELAALVGRAVLAAMQKLSERQQQVFALGMAGHSSAEMAKELGMAAAAIRQAWHRVKLALQEAMKAEP